VGMPFLPRATVVAGWLLTLLPKLFVHLGWI
jgi:hypothetical protein